MPTSARPASTTVYEWLTKCTIQLDRFPNEHQQNHILITVFEEQSQELPF